MLRTVSLGVIAFAVWLLWSGIYVPLTVGAGIVSCALVVWICRAKGILDDEMAPLHLSLGLLTYIPWLVWEVVKSNLDVTWRILHPKLPISPRLVRVRPSQSTDMGRAIHANSITLTPGTVTCDADGDEFTVHALTRETAQGVVDGSIDRRVCRLEGAG